MIECKHGMMISLCFIESEKQNYWLLLLLLLLQICSLYSVRLYAEPCSLGCGFATFASKSPRDMLLIVRSQRWGEVSCYSQLGFGLKWRELVLGLGYNVALACMSVACMYHGAEKSSHATLGTRYLNTRARFSWDHFILGHCKTHKTCKNKSY